MMNDKELADLDGTDPPERDDWITDVDATIHNLMGDDGENDDTNDWVHDVACALWKQIGLRDLARLRELSVRLSDSWYADIGERCDRLEAEVERLRAAGNELAHQAATGGIVGGRLDAALVAWRAALGEDR